MPIYTYKCVDCEKVFSVKHSMNEKYTQCNSVCCEEEGTLVKVLRPVSVKKQKSENKKVGSIVKQHIEETREEVKAEKERMQKEEYTPK